MKRWTVALLFAALVFGPGTAVLAHGDDEKHADEKGAVTVTGEILDMACYISHGAKGADHAACAKRCVKGGQPMGLLAKDGKVYLLYADHGDASAFESAKNFAGETVTISGTKSVQGGMEGIEVHKVESK